MRYQEQQKLQKHQKAEIAEHHLGDTDLKTVTGKTHINNMTPCLLHVTIFFDHSFQRGYS